MNQPLASTGWILLTTGVLVVALVPFDPQVSEWARALPDEVVDFNRAIKEEFQRHPPVVEQARAAE